MAAVLEINVLSEVEKTIASTLKMPAGKLDVDADFETFGMDSLIAMELMSNLSKRFNISVTPAQFTEVKTVRELAQTIEVNLLGAGAAAVAVAKPAVKEAAPVVQPQANVRPIVSSGRPAGVRAASVASGSGRRFAKKKTGRISLQKLLDYVESKFSIDLSYREFTSPDEIVDALVSDHLDELMSHYGLLDEPTASTAAAETDSTAAHNASRPLRESEDIAIVGISCNFPDAPNHRAFWENLIGQKNSIREIPKSRWDWEQSFAPSAAPNKTVSKWGALIGDVDRFDPEFFSLPPEHAALMDPQERLLMQEVYKAFQDAGLDIQKLAGSATGVFVGYEYSEYERYLRKHVGSVQNRPLYSSSSPTYYLANRLSFTFNFCGPSESININCASSAIAINRAYYSLLNNESDLAVAAGVSLNLFVDDYVYASQYGMLSPNGTCAVFDDNANGYTRGEGIGAVVLKRLDDAKRDNDRIYAVLKSCHQNNRGRANMISEIKHEAITGVLRDCYTKASISPETLSYIEVDGYSTKWGDSFEFEGIKNVFRDTQAKGKYCALGSLKGNIGHLEPASGVASVIKVALALHHKKFPATISKKAVSAFIDIKNDLHPLYIADTAIPFESIRRDPRTPVRAGVNSFADSGTNVHILLEEYFDAGLAPEGAAAPTNRLFILSARDRNRLQDCVQQYIALLTDAGGNTSFADMIYTLQVGREPMEERLAVIAASPADLLGKLKLAGKSGLDGGLEDRGIYRGSLEQIRKNPLVSLITKDLNAAQVEQSLQAAKWQQIALLWVNGVSVPWEKAWEGKPVRRMSLPGYPFARNRYWIESVANEESPVAISAITHGTAVPTEPESRAAVSAAEESAAGPVEAGWLFAADGVGDAGPMGPAEKMALFLKQEIAVQLQQPPAGIATDRNLLELGMNSIGIMNLVYKITDLLQVSFSPSVLFKYPDIEKFSGYLAATYPEKIEALTVAKKAQDVDTVVPEPLVPSPVIFERDRAYTEKRLAEIWAQLLNLDPARIGVDGNFFELGGHSQLLVELMSRIETEFSQSLPLSILIAAGTIAELAKLIFSEQTISSYDIVVPMQTVGDRTPIFGVPGADGGVLPLLPLSQALGDSQPFYGLQAVGLDGRTAPLDSVQRTALANIAAVKTVQAKGPYNLIGYSNGGVVAFEMARILLEQGEKVASLMFLDSIPPEQQISDEIDEIVDLCSYLKSVYGLDFHLDVAELQRVPESGRREYLYSLVAGGGLQITKRQFEINFEVINASERNCRNYRTSRLSKETNVCLYRATQGSRLLSRDYRWNEFLLSPIRIVDIEADHFGIVKEEASRAVARDIVLSARKRKRKMETV